MYNRAYTGDTYLSTAYLVVQHRTGSLHRRVSHGDAPRSTTTTVRLRWKYTRWLTSLIELDL